MKHKLISICISSLVGLLIPVIFVYLDLSELEMAFNLKNFIWDIESQRILKFSLPAFPLMFACAGYFYSKEKELMQKINKSEAEEKRNQHLASIGEMTSSVAHEINNPLAIINGTCMILKRQLDKDFDAEVFKKKVELISETCGRISKIVRSMQDITRDTAGEEPSPTSLQEIIGDVINIFEEQLKGSDIEIKYDLDPKISTAPLLLKRISLSRVFINLINNAVDAISNKPSQWIKITAELKGNMIKVFVEDSGEGIPKDVAERVFEPFFTSKDIGKGTGLGLSLSAKVVKEEGGDLYLDQERSHTTFVVEIPFKKSA